MEKVLVSACLLGQPVRYDGTGKGLRDPLLDKWRQQQRLVSFCPEIAGGLPVPRAAAERQENGLILTEQDDDVTAEFLSGARQALTLCQRQNIKLALLKEFSPSCGSLQVYNGKFSGEKIPGIGLTTELLRANGIKVFSEFQLVELDSLLD